MPDRMKERNLQGVDIEIFEVRIKKQQHVNGSTRNFNRNARIEKREVGSYVQTAFIH